MAKFIKPEDWVKFQNIINDFIEKDAGLQPFKWLRHSSIHIPSFGEDEPLPFTVINLNGLFSYNYMRVWPYNDTTSSGIVDNTNIVLYITKNQLNSLGYLNTSGYWDFNKGLDRFIVQGKAYKPSGDTQVSQINNQSLLFFLVLEILDETETNDLLNTYNQ